MPESRPGKAEREFLLRSLSQVGPDKPIGYLPLYTLRDFAMVEPADVAADAATRGLASAQFGPEACCIKTGALYVYHRDALKDLLHAHATTLAAANMSVEPGQFVAQIAAVWLAPSHPVYPIIGKAFGDST
jgi:hypothetical protein